MQITAVSPVAPHHLGTSSPTLPNGESDDKPRQNTLARQQPQGARLASRNDSLLNQLIAVDRRVRAHEAAHAAVGGRYAGTPSYSFQRGPNGKLFAVGGSVPIDTKPVPGDPQATIDKALTVQRAALAPTQPSSQDRAIAAKAAQMVVKARAELRTSEYNDEESSPIETNKKQQPEDRSGASEYQEIQDYL